ncbi:glutamine-hydrolyzing GMP synthase [Pantoea sp. Aalb]|uniref:glutamine-hydrolyzing GMP synthase n=1 Tax=Pantoea sp. Aalb TaxID=2576762 RepID=UPI001321DEE6|nr:glutamine-hydrolyzing GMP synthase [Pantoea sp. Aalb]MXP67264.1 glutamine-hydrolyzing GMP synthase [Pantoea sp. Aalb]
MKNKKNYKYSILILDFGSQYTHLLVRCIRKLGVYCELWSYDVSQEKISQFHPNGIILSGGPESTTELNSSRVPKYIFELNIPVLGICYGMHTMVMQLGGTVKKANKREFGYTQVELKAPSILVHNIKDDINKNGNHILNVWMSHGDKVTSIPVNFITIASTETCLFAIIANEKKHFYGVQFHPEVTHTVQGLHILKRFVYDICNCKPLWIPSKIITEIIKDVREKIGNDKVILGLSGGIDSSVTAILLHYAIGKQLICIFVDNGLLRSHEAQHVKEMFGDYFGLNILYVSAEDYFFKALIGEQDPEIKRKIIGRVFIEVFEKEASKIINVKWLAQGTIYPDIIESAKSTTGGKAHIIKSHHNVGGLPKKINLKLIEPLKELFKDEVRKIGLELGLPYDMLYRHPFPGPGLAIRILGEVKKEYCNLLRHADSIFIEELHKANLYNKVSQAFTIFLPVRSVGVMGDSRTYDWIIALRAVETVDFMTANWVNLPYDFLCRVSNRIINEINGISRVVYDISSKPPATIEWE